MDGPEKMTRLILFFGPSTSPGMGSAIMGGDKGSK
jgi:hypothetical protein